MHQASKNLVKPDEGGSAMLSEQKKMLSGVIARRAKMQMRIKMYSGTLVPIMVGFSGSFERAALAELIEENAVCEWVSQPNSMRSNEWWKKRSRILGQTSMAVWRVALRCYGVGACGFILRPSIGATSNCQAA